MSGAFLFGKLPTHGDFVARGLSAGEKEQLDDWLSAQIDSARSTFGEEFGEIFDLAPPWRFAWREDLRWVAGAAAPSMDSVGRRFPILIALRGVAPGGVHGVAEACEDLIYAALSEGWTADRLVLGVEEMNLTVGDEVPLGDCWWTFGGASFAETRLEGRLPANLMRTMLTKSEADA